MAYLVRWYLKESTEGDCWASVDVCNLLSAFQVLSWYYFNYFFYLYLDLLVESSHFFQ